MSRNLELALNKEGKVVTIFEVKTGLACKCYCPECRKPLIAKNKNKLPNQILKAGRKMAHFAHTDGSICPYANETAIHMLAKQILEESRVLLIPPIYYNGNIELTKRMKYKFDNVELEKQIKVETVVLQPDAILCKNGTQLFIEFKKSHAVDEEKRLKIEKLRISCLEIDLNGINPTLNGEVNVSGIKDLIENIELKKKWIYNVQAESLINSYIEKQKKLAEIKYEEFESKYKIREEYKEYDKEQISILLEERFLKRKLEQQVQEKIFESRSKGFGFQPIWQKRDDHSPFMPLVPVVECPQSKFIDQDLKIIAMGREYVSYDEVCKFCKYFDGKITLNNSLVICGFKNKILGKINWSNDGNGEVV